MLPFGLHSVPDDFCSLRCSPGLSDCLLDELPPPEVGSTAAGVLTQAAAAATLRWQRGRGRPRPPCGRGRPPTGAASCAHVCCDVSEVSQ